ncbi:MAG: arginine--tRNA ligase, partial [Alphaproteobacteria bacterium]
AGPGFINIRLADSFWCARVSDVLKAGLHYGDSEIGAGVTVNVEFVSANPTGPLHVGHARGAVVGDVLATLLAKAGFAVTREYYINDAGGQIDILARSAHLRYREAMGDDIGEIPEGLYPGDYLVDVGKALAQRDGAKWHNQPEEQWLPEFRTYTADAMMDLIKGDLAAMGVRHDIYTSERFFVDSDGVEKALDTLRSRNLVYRGTLEPPKGKAPEGWEPRPQLLFRATDFGDDTDRPLQKSDGTWTYFASDLAYHLDKYQRGFHVMIDVLGADHGGYVKRMKAGVKALTDGQGDLDVKLCQMVRLLADGKPAKMSKRAGTYVTLRTLLDQVGGDVVRFIMLTRKNDAALDFDLVKVTDDSRENPVFYVHYAHARCRSVLRHAGEELAGTKISAAALAGVDLSPLTDSAELALMKTMAVWPRTVESAALAHEPHRLAFYLQELAAAFHALWTKGKDDASLRFLVPDNPALSLARLALVQAVATVLASGMNVIGIEPLEELRS